MVCWSPRPRNQYLKLFPEASLGCVLGFLLLVQFQNPVLNVCCIYPCGIIRLIGEGVTSNKSDPCREMEAQAC